MTPPRAPRMTAGERKAMILDATIPLILEHGAAVTTRQIAESAGIAEGTVFRVFADKDELLREAVHRYFDPIPFHHRLRQIDHGLPVEQKVRHVIELLQERLRGVFAMGAALGPRRDLFGGAVHDHGEFTSIIARLLAPNAEELAVAPERIAHFLRVVAFSRALPGSDGGAGFSLDEITELVLYGIVRHGHGHGHGQRGAGDAGAGASALGEARR